MKHTFTIRGKLPNLNDYLKAERQWLPGGKGTKGNLMKKDAQKFIISQIRRDLKCLRINNPVRLYYHFYEPNMKRDKDNVASFAMKVVQDSLVLSNTLPNDGWQWITSFTCDFAVDKDNPRIVVDILEMDGD